MKVTPKLIAVILAVPLLILVMAATHSDSGSGIVAIGSQGYLRNTGGALGVVVAKTKDIESAITKAVAANDSIGEAQLIDSGAALDIPNGTQVQVIDMSFGLSQIRILSGSHLGESGWVPAEDVSAQ